MIDPSQLASTQTKCDTDQQSCKRPTSTPSFEMQIARQNSLCRVALPTEPKNAKKPWVTCCAANLPKILKQTPCSPEAFQNPPERARHSKVAQLGRTPAKGRCFATPIALAFFSNSSPPRCVKPFAQLVLPGRACCRARDCRPRRPPSQRRQRSPLWPQMDKRPIENFGLDNHC